MNELENPLANRDQCLAEEAALRVVARPEVQAARLKAGQLWRLGYGTHVPPEALPSFEAAMDEYVFNYVLKAVASDAAHPRFVRNFMPAHDWFGRRLPGARMGGDNPDNCYRLAGIAHGARYLVEGRPAGPAPRSVSFTLVANYGTSVTVQTLEFQDLERDAHGGFEITIGAEPAAGRVNTLRTRPGVKFLYVRDSMEDWQAETPLALSIRCLDPPAADPLTDSEMAARAVHRLIEDVPLYYWFTRLCSAKPVNTAASPEHSGPLGGLVTQAGSQSCLQLADDEAFLITLDPAGARYASVAAHDWWFRSLEYWQRTANFAQANSAANADGTFTYVVSPTDPGVHNWVDTCGRHEVLMVYRWQGLPAARVRGGPALSAAKHVKLTELEGLLPRGTATAGSAARERQRESRRSGFARRLQAPGAEPASIDRAPTG